MSDKNKAAIEKRIAIIQVAPILFKESFTTTKEMPQIAEVSNIKPLKEKKSIRDILRPPKPVTVALARAPVTVMLAFVAAPVTPTLLSVPVIVVLPLVPVIVVLPPAPVAAVLLPTSPTSTLPLVSVIVVLPPTSLTITLALPTAPASVVLPPAPSVDECDTECSLSLDNGDTKRPLVCILPEGCPPLEKLGAPKASLLFKSSLFFIKASIAKTAYLCYKAL